MLLTIAVGIARLEVIITIPCSLPFLLVAGAGAGLPTDEYDPGSPQAQVEGGLFPQAGGCSSDDGSFS